MHLCVVMCMWMRVPVKAEAPDALEMELQLTVW